MKDKNKYNETIILPKTTFSMRANLPEQELKTIEFWDKIELLKKIKESAKNKELFVLHDGPPYANGPIHMGTAANKILKDIINRTMYAEGYNSMYVPGWDCHGLPIEWQIEKNYRKKGYKKEDIPIKEFREECRNFAKKWIEEQKKSFIRLFIQADWSNPYLTMDFASEAAILKEFSKFFLDGSLYRGSKPVMWSPVEKTALAEAEIEYKDILSKSIYAAFETINCEDNELKNSAVIIWTTTPWTLPGNQMIAFGKDIDYCLLKVISSENKNLINKKYILAKKLVAVVTKECNIFQHEIVKELKGIELKGQKCIHPLNGAGYENNISLYEGDFVDENEGSGFVHIAPAYGEDDYILAKKNNIEIIDILEDGGTYKKEIPLFSGMHVFKADEIVIKEIAARNKLIGIRNFNHSYPHSWRSKKPIIYRTTPQWFISMEKKQLREKALKSIDETEWFPENSKNRIRNMVKERPDWCISRQRTWGVPLTIFINKKTGKPLRDENIMNKIIEDVKKNGSDVWLSEDPYKYLGYDIDADNYEVVYDILDVWFDSGSTHAFVLEDKLKWPADIYLEGTDQHRGFFQSSLLESCGTRGSAPFKSVITHGFVLDGTGRKMSKSLGNVVKPEDIIKKSGVDILRLWVAMTDYADDMRISDEILSNLNDYYRRIRNTFRFLLGNLDKENHYNEFKVSEIYEIDAFILARVFELEKIRLKSVKSHKYYLFYKALFEFCTVDLSSFYFDISKDILYCNKLTDNKRISRIRVLGILYDVLLSWYSPILCHTTEEAWQLFKTEDLDSIHLRTRKNIDNNWQNKSLVEKWTKLKKVRRNINTAIENARSEKKIGTSLEAKILLSTKDKQIKELVEMIDMTEVCLISEFTVIDNQTFNQEDFLTNYINENEQIEIRVYKTRAKQCLRCWQYKKEVTEDKELCNRCIEATKS